MKKFSKLRNNERNKNYSLLHIKTQTNWQVDMSTRQVLDEQICKKYYKQISQSKDNYINSTKEEIHCHYLIEAKLDLVRVPSKSCVEITI